ncbi:MAG: hypothetical protein KJO24_04740, partial [Gammaproteobacteria bacterium]|nr:hypothetical protein [Gammaproteobacteria bacterium]
EPEVNENTTPTSDEEPENPVDENFEPPIDPALDEEGSDPVIDVADLDDGEITALDAELDESGDREVEQELKKNEPGFEVAQVTFNLVRLQNEYTPYSDPLTLVQFGGFVDAVDQMREDIIDAALDNAPVVGSTFAVSAGMSAGYVAWLARSGAVLGSVMSAMPMWRFIDPLPVLNKLDDDSDDEESLEAIIEKSANDTAQGASHEAVEDTTNNTGKPTGEQE